LDAAKPEAAAESFMGGSLKIRALCSALVIIGAYAGAQAAIFTVANSNDSGYTAIVRGVRGTIRISVVEVYAFVLTRTATEKL